MTLAEITYKTDEITNRIESESSFYKSLMVDKMNEVMRWYSRKKTEYENKYLNDPDILSLKRRDLENELNQRKDKLKKDIQAKIDEMKSILMSILTEKKNQMSQSIKTNEEMNAKIESENNAMKANINNYLV